MLASRIRTFGIVIGWLTLAFIAFATLSPIQDRPSFAADPHVEHFAAFAVMALALVVGYPRRTMLVALLVVFSAFTLEAMQLLTPDRHGHLADAIFKVAGGLAGIGAGQLLLLLVLRKLSSR